MNINNMKAYITLSLSCLLIASGSHASYALERPSIISTTQTNIDPAVYKQHRLNGTPQPAPSEALLQEAKINSRLEAAALAYQQSIIATSRKEPDTTYAYLQEAIQLHPSNPEYLQPASKLAFALGKYDEAEMYQLMLLKVVTATLPAPDHIVATMLDNLALIYFNQSRIGKAESLLHQSLAIREQTLGDMHPWVSISLNKIAGLKMHLNKPDKAEELLIRSLHIQQTAKGNEHSQVAMAMHKLANFYRGQQKNLTRAESLYQQAADVWHADNSGGWRLDLAVNRRGLGELYVAQGRFDDAREQFEKMQALLKQALSEGHPAIDAARNRLVRLDNKRALAANTKQLTKAPQEQAIQ